MRVLAEKVLRLHLIARCPHVVLRTLVALVALGALCGCSPTPAPHHPRVTAKNQIDELFSQIREWRREACLPLDPREDLIGFAPTSRRQPAQVCSTNAAAGNELCSLADATCDNGETICDIADELDTDLWANEKCASAKASCRDTQELCCASMDAPVKITECS